MAGRFPRPGGRQPCRPTGLGAATQLTETQEKILLRWLTESPLHHGFGTELWTAPRLAQLIQEEFGVRFNPRYLSAWLRNRGLTPQKPQCAPPPPASATRGSSLRGWSPTDRASNRLSLEKLPPYAPMLNPVEPLWSWLRWERLSNFGPKDVRERDARVIAELAEVREDQALLWNLFHASELPFPRALLS